MSFSNQTAQPDIPDQDPDTPAPGAVSSAAPAPMTAGGAGPVKVVWLSIDPRAGSVSVYPPEVAERIESAHASCRRSAPLAGCGGFYDNATIEFASEEPRIEHLQRTATGKRDVRRIEAPARSAQITVSVVRERCWRIVEFEVPGVTEPRRIDISSVSVGGGHGAPPVSSFSAASGSEDSAARKRSLAETDAKGLVGIWEWCRIPEPPNPTSVPDKDWGVYTEEQNTLLENSYRAGLGSVTLELGIRTYDIVFDGGPDCGRQVDRVLRKRRYVRRRKVPPAERDGALAAASAAGGMMMKGDEEEECAICFSAFAETATMPIVRLPGCGHTFHGACARQLADKKAQCPMCRADVDWHAAFGPSTRIRM